jgi:hypothetical protein
MFNGKFRPLFTVVACLVLLAWLSSSACAEENSTASDSATASISAKQAESALQNAKNAVEVMKNANVGVQRVSDLLQDAEIAHSEQRYAHVLQQSSEIVRLKTLAFSLRTEMAVAEGMGKAVQQIGVQPERVNASLASLEEGKSWFALDNYEVAQEKVAQSKSELEEVLRSHFALMKNKLGHLKGMAMEEGIQTTRLDYLLLQLEKNEDAGMLDTAPSFDEEISRLNASLAKLARAQDILGQMEAEGLPRGRAFDMLQEALSSFQLGNDAKAAEFAEELEQVGKEATQAAAALKEAELALQEAAQGGYNTDKSQMLLGQAREKFLVERFEEAGSLAAQAQQQFAGEKSSFLFGAVMEKVKAGRVFPFLKRYWQWMAASAVLVAVAAALAWNHAAVSLARWRLEQLRSEEEAIVELIKKLQESYYKRKDVSKLAYEATLDKHQEHLMAARQSIRVWQERLKSSVEKEAKEEVEQKPQRDDIQKH